MFESGEVVRVLAIVADPPPPASPRPSVPTMPSSARSSPAPVPAPNHHPQPYVRTLGAAHQDRRCICLLIDRGLPHSGLRGVHGNDIRDRRDPVGSAGPVSKNLCPEVLSPEEGTIASLAVTRATVTRKSRMGRRQRCAFRPKGAAIRGIGLIFVVSASSESDSVQRCENLTTCAGETTHRDQVVIAFTLYQGNNTNTSTRIQNMRPKKLTERESISEMSTVSHPPSGPLVSLQLSPTPGHRRDLSSSESSSRNVVPVTGPCPQKQMLSEQGVTPVKRNQVPRQPKRKIRSRLTGLATPFHIDIRRRPHGVFLRGKLPSRTLKGNTKQPGVTNVDAATNDSKPVNYKPIFRREFGSGVGCAGKTFSTPVIPEPAASLDSAIEMTAPPYCQSQSGGSEGSLRFYDGFLASPVGCPVRDEQFPSRATLSNYEVGSALTGYGQRNDVDAHEWFGISPADLCSKRPDEHLSSSEECDNDTVDLIIRTEDTDRGDADLQDSDSEGNDSPEEENDAEDIIMEGSDWCYDSGDNCDKTSDILEGSITEGGETDSTDMARHSSSASSQEMRSRKRLLSFLARDIKCIQRQSQDAPCTKGDIQMILDHLHRIVKLEKNQTTHKETCTGTIPCKTALPADRRNQASMTVKFGGSNWRGVKPTHSPSCQCDNRPLDRPSDPGVNVRTRVKMKSRSSKSEDLAACLKVQFLTNLREKKNSKRRSKPLASYECRRRGVDLDGDAEIQKAYPSFYQMMLDGSSTVKRSYKCGKLLSIWKMSKGISDDSERRDTKDRTHSALHSAVSFSWIAGPGCRICCTVRQTDIVPISQLAHNGSRRTLEAKPNTVVNSAQSHALAWHWQRVCIVWTQPPFLHYGTILQLPLGTDSFSVHGGFL
ncbi:hypothetical protein EDB85DRAFT_1900758 [Lactarius pseudohatsudake]|nr:hypothetical protein EDB85DRAFT_1900758 [Lactarius pseudohatsudake]